jgi:hypothetical protein
MPDPLMGVDMARPNKNKQHGLKSGDFKVFGTQMASAFGVMVRKTDMRFESQRGVVL